MELDSELIQKFLTEATVNRAEMIHRMLFSNYSCGILEVWDWGRGSTGNRIIVTYELDETVPYGEIHSIVKPRPL